MIVKADRKNILVNVGIFVCGLIVGGALVHFFGRPETPDALDKEEHCGKDYPQVYGVDISFWQGHIHWKQLSLPCDENGYVSGKIPAPRNQRPAQFAFIRVTKGDALVDSLYQENYNEAKKQGITCGAYHFLTDTVSGKVQADLFLSHARFESGDLPPVLDVEIDSPTIVAKAKEWLDIVEKECGVKAIIYTNMHVYATRIKNEPDLNEHDLWLAKPRGEMPDVPNCKFWQFSHEGHIWGVIDNVVDLNMFNGTQEQLREYIHTKGINKEGTK